MRENNFETFSFIKLFEGECEQKEVYEKEKYFIKKYDTLENGLNGNEGGDGNKAPGKHNPNARRVICETTGEVFESVKEVAERFGLDNSDLSSHMTGRDYKNGIGKRKLGKPHFFKYLDREGDNRTISDETRKKISERMTKQNSKKVLNKTTGEVYNSLNEASEHLGFNVNSISQHINGKMIIKSLKQELEYIDTKENQ